MYQLTSPAPMPAFDAFMPAEMAVRAEEIGVKRRLWDGGTHWLWRS